MPDQVVYTIEGLEVPQLVRLLHKVIRRARSSDDPHIVEVSDIAAVRLFLLLGGTLEELDHKDFRS